MKIYFNANNKAHLEALKTCGVKNVMLSFRYSYANIKKFRREFDSIFVVAGTNSDPDEYHDFHGFTVSKVFARLARLGPTASCAAC